MLNNTRCGLISKAAITTGLGIALAVGAPTLLPCLALAAEGTVTISQQNNENATYDAFMLFKADISPDDQAAHITWASDSMKKIVLSFLDSNGYTKWLESKHPGKGQRDLPQNAAQYISEMIAGSKTAAGTATKPRTTAAASFANKLAVALASNDASPRQVATSGKPFSGPQGYWLFATTPSTTGDPDDAGSAPIWVPLGGSTTAILEKSSVPTADKDVMEDSTGSWGKFADAHVGQAIGYRLTGTLPSNFNSFEHYHFMFTDTLSAGLDLDIEDGKTAADSVVVQVAGKTVPVDGKSLKVEYDNRKLVIDFADLMAASWSSYGISGGTKITVTYKAHLNDACIVGTPGNPNEVSVTYSNDPVSGGEGHTSPGKTKPKTYTYRMTLKKLDEQTGEPLQGAEFTIRVGEGNSDKQSVGLYVQSDGSLGKSAHTFTTNKSGTFVATGLDEGTYVISETMAPEGYERIDSDLTLNITADRDKDGLELADLKADLKGGDAKDAGAVKKTSVAGLDAKSGSISLDVTNDRMIKMPVTGLGGTSMAVSLGGFTAIVAGIGLVARRRR